MRTVEDTRTNLELTNPAELRGGSFDEPRARGELVERKVDAMKAGVDAILRRAQAEYLDSLLPESDEDPGVGTGGGGRGGGMSGGRARHSRRGGAG